MDNIELRVKEKLKKFNLEEFYMLSTRIQQRLLEIEDYIYKCTEKRKYLLEEYKNYSINKSTIANQDSINLTRKTIHNNEILRIYIDKSIEEDRINDPLRDNLNNKYEVELNEIKEQYNKMIVNIVDQKKLQYEVKDLKKQIDRLNVEINSRNDIIKEQQEKTERLNKLLNKHGITNLIELNKK